MTKCKIDNDVDSMPQWISGELFVGSGKKYEDLKEKQVLVLSETMSGKDIFVALPNGWTTTKCFLCRYLKGVHNGIVLALSLLMHMKDLVEEQTVNISEFAWHGRCSTAPTNYPKVTQYVIQMLHN